MEMAKLKRDAAKISSSLLEDKSGICIAKQQIHVLFPERFLFVQLANRRGGINCVGFFMVMDNDNNYAVYNLPGMIRLNPDNMDEVFIDGVKHVRLSFEAGSKVIKTNEVVEEKKLVYYIYKELIENAKIPVYFDETDLLNSMSKCPQYNSVKLYKNINVFHMLVSINMRDANDLSVPWRNSNKGTKLGTIPMGDPTYGSAGGMARITSGHFSDNLTGAILEENRDVTDLEFLLRGT